MRVWLEKQRNFVDFTLSSLARRKSKNLGLLAVYALLVFVLASVMLFSHALRSEAARLLADSPELILQRMVAGRHDLIPPDYLKRIGDIRGVQRKEGRLWGYFYDPAVKANYTVMVSRVAGLQPGSIEVGAGVARARRLEAGNVLTFRSYDGQLFSFDVVAILPRTAELVSADLILMNERDFRAFFAIPEGHYTDIALSVANPREVRTVAAKLVAALPDSRPVLREELLRTYAAILDWREGTLLALLSGAILAFAILAWEKASGLSAEERHEIGLLKALGWDTSDVVRMKLWEGVLLSLTAFLLGYLGAYVHVFHSSAALFAPVLKGWSVLYPSFELTPRIDALQVATLFFFTVFPYAAAVLVPIWRAATTDPDAVMR